MTKSYALLQIDREIENLKRKYNSLDSKDYTERGIILGRINGLLTSKLYIYQIEEK